MKVSSPYSEYERCGRMAKIGRRGPKALYSIKSLLSQWATLLLNHTPAKLYLGQLSARQDTPTVTLSNIANQTFGRYDWSPLAHKAISIVAPWDLSPLVPLTYDFRCQSAVPGIDYPLS